MQLMFDEQKEHAVGVLIEAVLGANRRPQGAAASIHPPLSNAESDDRYSAEYRSLPHHAPCYVKMRGNESRGERAWNCRRHLPIIVIIFR